MPSLKLFSDWAEANHQIKVVGLSMDDSTEKVRQFLTATLGWKIEALPFTILIDLKMSLADLHKVERFPETFLIGEKGEVIDRVVGERNWNSEESKQWLISKISK